MLGTVGSRLISRAACKPAQVWRVQSAKRVLREGPGCRQRLVAGAACHPAQPRHCSAACTHTSCNVSPLFANPFPLCYPCRRLPLQAQPGSDQGMQHVQARLLHLRAGGEWLVRGSWWLRCLAQLPAACAHITCLPGDRMHNTCLLLPTSIEPLTLRGPRPHVPQCRFKHTRLQGPPPDPETLEACKPREHRNLNIVANQVRMAMSVESAAHAAAQ